MTFKDHFSHDSSAYKTHRPQYEVSLVDHLAAGLDVRKLAVDVGCGSGQFTHVLAERFDHVIGYDGSASQIENAEPNDRIDYRVGKAEDLKLEPLSVDMITVLQAAHWFDLPAFYARADRALKPGGVLALVAYGLARITPDIDAAVDDFYTRGIGAYWPPERAHFDDEYASLPFPYDEPAMPRYEMKVEWTFDQLKGYLGTWSAVGEAKKVLGFNPLDAFTAKLREVWGDAETHTVCWPLFMRYGRKPLV